MVYVKGADVRYVIDVDDEGTRTHLLAFDSVTEQCGFVVRRWTSENPPVVRGEGGRPSRRNFFRVGEDGNGVPYSWQQRKGWLGRLDLRDWYDLPAAMVTPWERGMRAVHRMREAIRDIELPSPVSIRRKSEWRDDGGGDFDLDRFVDGKAPYRAPAKREQVSRQFVTLLCDNVAGRETESENMYWRGVVASVVAEKLEEAGYSVEIFVYEAGRESLLPNPARGVTKPQNLICGVWVKRFEDHLDIGAIVTAAAPWYFRIVTFATYHLIPHEEPEPEYGYVSTIDKAVIEHITRNEDAIIIARAWDQWQAERLATRILSKFGRERTEDAEGDDE